MAEYYLVAQLPSLDGVADGVPLPITEEEFADLCARFLNRKAQKAMEGLTLLPDRDPAPTGSAVLDGWNRGERDLRLALGKIRAEKQKKSFDGGVQPLPLPVLQVAKTATELDSPMEAELFLHRTRLEFLETLRPMDGFSEEYVFYFGLKLKLLWRIRWFDPQQGAAAYQQFYHSILNGEGQGA